jgi:rhodanese-related sulfurtransferase
MKTISREELKGRLDSGEALTLIEALPRRYYIAGHLPGAINLPHDQVRELAPTLLPDKRAPLVVYCASTECRNSRIAAQTLESLGYDDVMEYVEGKADWTDAGYALHVVSE